jgi:hypothetical protein
MRHTRQQKRFAPQPRKTTSADGVDFVRCRICGDRRRVISGRHLSKHGTDREEYMQEYGLSPDELIAKDFRIIVLAMVISRMARRTGLRQLRESINAMGTSLPGDSKTDIHISIPKVFGFWRLG